MPSVFERYVNFEFYKTVLSFDNYEMLFERYVNFEFYKTLWRLDLRKTSLRDM